MSKRNADSDEARLAYNKARKKVKQMTRRVKRKFEKDIGRKCKTNPKVFWSHIRSKLKTKTGVAPLLENVQDKNSVRFSDTEKANILQTQFCSVFTREPEGELPHFPKTSSSYIGMIHITHDMVKDEIRKLNVNKSCGPDDIHARILIELVDHLGIPIAVLLNKTLESGEVPLDWKKAKITPIFKKGARNNPANYRPISLTSVICKLMETFVKKCHHETLEIKQPPIQPTIWFYKWPIYINTTPTLPRSVCSDDGKWQCCRCHIF